MRLAPLIVVVVFVVGSAVAEKDTNPANYPLVAHVESAVFTHTTAPSNVRTTELRVGKLIYVASSICKEAVVGSDFPARIEGKKIMLLIGDGKVCGYRIVGTKEAH
ncbi:MAG TPA: hypothetical protein VG225_04695 [Terracidiphilus sp.]|jgi:hypothetical protein|nr:hypothetical protein [Terracidiphilus sp.]